MESSNISGGDASTSDVAQYSTENGNMPPEIVPAISGSEDSAERSSKRKVPRRILHFSDGVLEEYSTDEEEECVKKEIKEVQAVDTKRLTWPQYIFYATTVLGSNTLKFCDYVGEGLASFFGITTPKFQYEINEFERMVKEQEEEKKKDDLEMSGWRKPQDNAPASVVSSSPSTAVTTVSETQDRY